MKTILIFGYGYVGKYLSKCLADNNWEVISTSRDKKKHTSQENKNISILPFDDPRLPNLLKTTDYIISTIPPSKGSNGSDPVLKLYGEHIKQNSFLWIGYLSATSVYGDHQGRWVDETTPPQPASEFGKRRLYVENEWLDLYRNLDSNLHILRLSGIYGPDKNAICRIKSGKQETIVKQGHFFSRIHVKDICHIIKNFLNSKSKGGVFNISDDQPAQLDIVDQYAANLLYKKPQFIDYKRAKLSTMSHHFFEENKRIKNDKVKKHLNIKLLFSNYKVGLKEEYMRLLKSADMLITGGTGFIGSHLIRRLKPKDNIVILARNPQNIDHNCIGIKSLDELPNDIHISTIINLAGSPINVTWGAKNRKKIKNSRTFIISEIHRLCQRLAIKPNLVITMSGIGIYGSNTELIDETTPTSPSFLNSVSRDSEDAAHPIKKLGTRLCTARLGIVLGRKGGRLKRLLIPFKLGLGAKIGDGQQYMSWIHIDDLIDGFQHFINNSVCDGVYNLTSPHYVNNATFTKAICKILRKPALFSIPAWLIKLVFGQMGKELLLSNSRVIPQRLLDEKFKFKYSKIEEALQDLLR